MSMRMSNKQMRLIVANSIIAVLADKPKCITLEDLKNSVYDAVRNEHFDSVSVYGDMSERALDELDRNASKTAELTWSVLYKAVCDYSHELNKSDKQRRARKRK